MVISPNKCSRKSCMRGHQDWCNLWTRISCLLLLLSKWLSNLYLKSKSEGTHPALWASPFVCWASIIIRMFFLTICPKSTLLALVLPSRTIEKKPHALSILFSRPNFSVPLIVSHFLSPFLFFVHAPNNCYPFWRVHPELNTLCKVQSNLGRIKRLLTSSS